MVRQPAVAGSFYSADRKELLAQVDSYLRIDDVPSKVKGIIVPHAGYVYSGAVAGEVFSLVEIPRKVILIGPNHHGAGENVAVSGADNWMTPLVSIPLATELRDQLVADIFPLVIDDRAHEFEHSLEVMLPFLSQRQSKLEIVPIVIGALSLADALQLGSDIAKTIASCNEDVLVLASTDMNHFASAKVSKKLDFMAIEAMEGYDLQRLYRVVRENNISMCGVLPTIIAMQATLKLGAQKCQLVRYAHSGEINGDNNRVVGYAGLTIK